MSETDYKKLWKNEKLETVRLNNKISAILNQINPATDWLKGQISEDMYKEFLNKMGIDIEVQDAKRNN